MICLLSPLWNKWFVSWNDLHAPEGYVSGCWRLSCNLWPLFQGHQRINGHMSSASCSHSVPVLGLAWESWAVLVGASILHHADHRWPQVEAWWGGHLSLFEATFPSVFFFFFFTELANKQLKDTHPHPARPYESLRRKEKSGISVLVLLKILTFCRRGILALTFLFQNYCLQAWFNLITEFSGTPLWHPVPDQKHTMGEWGSWNIYAPTLAAPGCPGCLKEPWHTSLLWVQVRQLPSASGPLAIMDQAPWLSKSYVDWRNISWNRILSGLWLMSTLRTQCICLFFSQGSYNFILVP